MFEFLAATLFYTTVMTDITKNIFDKAIEKLNKKESEDK